MTILQLGSAADVHWNQVHEAAFRLKIFSEQMRIGKLPYVAAQYKRLINCSENIMTLNRQHLRHGYNASADDGILVLTDQIGDILRQLDIATGYMELVRFCLANIRGAVYARSCTSQDVPTQKRMSA